MSSEWVMTSIFSLTAFALSLAGWRAFVLTGRARQENQVEAQLSAAGPLEFGFDENEWASLDGDREFAQLVAEGLRLVRRGDARVVRRLRPLLEHRARDLQSGLSFLATMAVVLPLLGLLGTVFGMVKSFGAIGAQGDPVHLSDGIAEALGTTQAGLVTALAIIIAHGLLDSRCRRLVARGERTIRGLESRVRGLEGQRSATEAG